MLSKSTSGVVFSDHNEDLDGSALFKAACCEMGLEGIVAKRKDKAYVAGPCKYWAKVKNPRAPAMLWFLD